MSPLIAAGETAGSIKWTDSWTAVGTVGLAVVTVLGLVLAWLQARKEQKAAESRVGEAEARAKQDREDADRRLREERKAADERLRQERVDADRRQMRDRQIGNAESLLRRIAALHPHLWSAAAPPVRDPRSFNSVQSECDEAIHSLRAGAHADALGLGNETATQLYRKLVNLVVSARRGDWIKGVEEPAAGSERQKELRDRRAHIAVDLRNYSRYVRLWLGVLLREGTIPEDLLGAFATSGAPDVPILGVKAYSPAWQPNTPPPGWTEDTDTDPDDPDFRASR